MPKVSNQGNFIFNFQFNVADKNTQPHTFSFFYMDCVKIEHFEIKHQKHFNEQIDKYKQIIFEI